MKYLLLLGLVILLVGCWTGGVRVKGIYMEEMMNGQTWYYVDLADEADIRVTEKVFFEVAEEFAKLNKPMVTKVEQKGTLWAGTPHDSIRCDFEAFPGSKIYDTLVYCD